MGVAGSPTRQPRWGALGPRRIVEMVARAVVLATAILVTLSPRAGRAQSPEEYEHVVDEYRIGDPEAAVRRLARWPESAVDESVRYWAKRLRSEQVVAAAMVHTELAAAILDSLPSRTNAQLRRAAAWLDALAARHDEREHADAVRLHWYRVVISLYAASSHLYDADLYAREALGRFPRDPALIFQKGTVLELARFTNSTSAPVALPRGRAPASATRQEQRLESAAAEYRRALDLDPRLAIARLHLGWINAQEGNSHAHQELATALEDAKDDRTRYLAHLFLGSLAELQHRFDEAAQEYELAHQLGPTHQTPYVALSRIELVRGHPERARELALELAALDRIDDDPWWDYHLGSVDDEALTWLRAEAHVR